MRFKRSAQRYGRTPEPETPYQRAGQLWDERIGSARVQARNWRLMAFGGLALTTAMSAALVWQSLQSKVVPYVVAVDRLGEARAVSEAERDYQPSDAQVAWHLARFIEHVRSVSLDPVLMRRDWLSAYDFVTRRGVRTGTSSWTGILTVVRKAPTSAETLRRNPLGIYIDAIDWSRELDPAPAATPSPTPASLPPANVPRGSPLDPTLAAEPTSPTVPENRQ